MKKKILIGLMAIMICTLLVGCGKKEEKNNNSNKESSTSKEKIEYTYFDGKLTQIVDEEGKAKQTDFVIDGIILLGNRHSYDGVADTDSAISKFASLGYKKENLNKDFYLNEWIELYIDTKYTGSSSDVKILITPHKSVEDLEKMSLSDLTSLAEEKGYVIDYKEPEKDNYKYVGNGYVNADFSEGKYDILFTYKGKLAYFININETKEPSE